MLILKNCIRAAAFVLWLALTALNLYVELAPGFLVDVPEKLLFAAGFCLLWTIVFPPTWRHMRQWLTVLLIYYIWMLLNLLFFDAAFGREAVHYGVNLQPFYTIRSYLRAYQRGYIPEIALINLLGNLAAFAPMGFFLPSLFRRQGNLLCFFPTMTVMIAAVECIQVATSCGSGDVDDLILNLTGAVVSWLVLWPLSRHVNRYLRRGKP